MSKTKSNPNSASKTTTDTSKPTNPLTAIAKQPIIGEFKEFINRGNVVDLAIGVAVGGAFTTIAKSLVDDIIMPIVSLIAGGLDFTSLAIDIPNIFGADTVAHIAYGNFIQNVVNFLIIAFTVFIIVRTLNRLNRLKEKEQKAADDAAKKSANDTTSKKSTDKATTTRKDH